MTILTGTLFSLSIGNDTAFFARVSPEVWERGLLLGWGKREQQQVLGAVRDSSPLRSLSPWPREEAPK